MEGIGKMEEEERGVSVMELKQRSAIVLCCVVLWFVSIEDFVETNRNCFMDKKAQHMCVRLLLLLSHWKYNHF